MDGTVAQIFVETGRNLRYTTNCYKQMICAGCMVYYIIGSGGLRKGIGIDDEAH